jgi:hypothetical protein
MYEDYPPLKKPVDENTVIWRYMDFTKFASLLQKNALFFRTVYALTKEDYFEGALSQAGIIHDQTFFAKFLQSFSSEQGQEIRRMSLDAQASRAKDHARHIAVNCWHMGDEESAAMWRLYAQSEQGIAIRSTFARLKDCFSKTTFVPFINEGEKFPLRVYIGEVQYIDFDKDFQSGDHLVHFTYKRKSFSHEHELRAIVHLSPLQIKPTGRSIELKRLAKDFQKLGGIYIDSDLNRLVEAVVLSPKTPRWQQELVGSLVEKYGFSFPIKGSVLDSYPKKLK